MREGVETDLRVLLAASVEQFSNDTSSTAEDCEIVSYQRERKALGYPRLPSFLSPTTYTLLSADPSLVDAHL